MQQFVFTWSKSLCEQAIFAKYDAVELYLTKRTYPPGLNYVEKNTFRRFCKKFAIKGLYSSAKNTYNAHAV